MLTARPVYLQLTRLSTVMCFCSEEEYADFQARVLAIDLSETEEQSNSTTNLDLFYKPNQSPSFLPGKTVFGLTNTFITSNQAILSLK